MDEKSTMLRAVAVAILTLSAPLMAQPSLTAKASGRSTSSSQVTSSAFNAGTGNVAIVFVTANTMTVSNVTDSAGNTYGLVQTSNPSAATGWDQNAAYCSAYTRSSSNNTVTARLSGADNQAQVIVLEYSGIPGCNSIDLNPAPILSGFTNPAFTGLTTTFPNEVIIMECQFAYGFAATAGNLNNQPGTVEANASNYTIAEDWTVTNVLTNVSASMTASHWCSCLLVSYKGAASLPSVTTIPATSTSDTDALSGGSVTNNGGASITSEGVCYATTTNPTSPCTNDGSSPSFMSNLTGLVPNTTYHYRAYATNSTGTSYGSDLTFTTTPPDSLGADLHLAVQGATQTQIVVSYTATTPDSCFLIVTDLNGGPDVSDVNPAKFANANQDLSRTYGNGFRWPTICGESFCSAGNTDVHRRVIIGGHDEIKRGLDGKFYSTALQVASPHSIKVVCNSGADIRTIKQTTTAELPLASNYPELPIPIPGSPLGGMPQPTIDWSRAGKKTPYTDPITGVLIQRVTGADEMFSGRGGSGPAIAAAFQSPVLDVNGGAWTNPNNFVTSQVSGTLATTTTPNAPIFAAFAPSFNPGLMNVFTDILVTPYGGASANTVVSEWCLSFDSGQTCANFTPLDVTMATSARAYAQIPSAVPSSNFSAWGGMKSAFGNYDMYNCPNLNGFGAGCGTNVTLIGVSASGNIVTAPGTDLTKSFYMGLVPGSKFSLKACASGTDQEWLTVASVSDPFHITTVEGGLNLSNCNYVDKHAGIRAILKNPGTLNLSLTATAYQTGTFTSTVGGDHYMCARSKVMDIQTDCDGNTHNPPISGYLCMAKVGISGIDVFLIQDNGRICQQSAANGLQYSQSYSENWTSSNSFWAFTTVGGANHIFQATHVPNNYQEMPVDTNFSQDTRFTWTDLGPSTLGANQVAQIASACAGHPASDPSCIVSNGIANGFFSFGYEWENEDASGNAAATYNATGGFGCAYAWFDANGNLLSLMPPFGSYPVSYSYCHSGPSGASGQEIINVQAFGQLGGAGFTTSTPLAGPFLARVTGTRKNGSFVNQTLAISSCTQASPAVCTSQNHNMTPGSVGTVNSPQGNYAVISGAAGAGCAALNGVRYLHVLSPGTFSVYSDPQGQVPVDLSGCAALGGSVTATTTRPLYAFQISAVSDNVASTGTHGARFTVNISEPHATQFYPSIGSTGIANIVYDADPIAINQRAMNSTKQYYARVFCAGCSNAQFDVYSDSALTTAVPYATLSGATNWLVLYAETCPDPATLNLPSPLFPMDTGIGSTGNQKVRCVTLQYGSEFESDYPAASEHAAFPPCTGAGAPYPACVGAAAEASNAQKSMAHTINVGDAMMDINDSPQYGEIMMALAVDRSQGENQIRVTYVRTYGDDPNYGWHGFANGPASGEPKEHSVGWYAYGTSLVPNVLAGFMNNPPQYRVAPYNGAHGDTVRGATIGNLTSAVDYDPTVPDAKVNVTPDQFVAPATHIHNSIPNFGLGSSYSFHYTQSYPSKRMIPGQAPATELVWNGDWAAPNDDFGSGQNNGDIWQAPARALSSTGIPNVWQIPSLSPINIKVAPVYVADHPWNYFTDVSGPGSSMTSASVGTFCYAYSAGECVTGSSAGNVYFKASTFYNNTQNGGACVSNDASIGSPCALGLAPIMGWALQVRQVPPDANATGMRRLTQGFWPPLGQYCYYNWLSTPDAKWGLFIGNPIQQRPRPKEYAGSHVFAMKLPQWPTVLDAGNDRTRLSTRLKISQPARSGESLRIAFGYGENGDPANLFCTTRQEKCWTAAAATDSNPFLFAGEAQSKTVCNTGCSVSIPAIPGRIVFYQVERTNGSDVHLGPVEIAAVP